MSGIDKTVTSSARGEYWRLLLPGTYTLRASVDGCREETRPGPGRGRETRPLDVGVVARSRPVEVTITEGEQLVVVDLVLTELAECTNGPR